MISMIDFVQAYTMPAAFALMPPRLNSPAARALLLTIGQHESGFRARKQLGGPARGFWQFEVNGVVGVVKHPTSRPILTALTVALGYRFPRGVDQCRLLQKVLEHQDVLACGFARALLLTLPAELPGPVETSEAWRQYLEAWRPGAFAQTDPYPTTWATAFSSAWARVLSADEFRRVHEAGRRDALVGA